MNEEQPTNDTRLTATARLLWGALIVLTLYVCYFSHLGVVGLVGPDEPRYAWIARDMAETGDWVTPRLYGKPWFEKPVLYYWGAALSFKIFGVSDAAARLPSAIAALLATLAMAWLAWKFYGGNTARWLLVLLPTSVGMIGFSHAASTDMPFSGMLTIAMVCAAVVLGLIRKDSRSSEQRTPWAALVLFGFFLGLAVLAKGPAAIILSGGGVFVWAVFTKRWRDAFRLFHPAAILSFLATALPWYVVCANRNPDFFQVFIIEHNFKRYLTPEFQHIQPFWYYVPVVLVAFLPWTAALLWATISKCIQIARSKTISGKSLFLLTWAAFCLLFFSTSHSKLPGYVLPAIPSIAVLLSHLISRELSRSRSLAMSFAGLALGFLLAAFSMQFVLKESGRINPGAAATYAAVLLAMAAANLFLSLPNLLKLEKQTISVISVIGVLFALLPVLSAHRIIPNVTRTDPSARSLARAIKLQSIPEDKVVLKDAQRSYRYGLSFYLHREILDWDGDVSRDVFIASVKTSCKELAGQKNQNMQCKDVELGPLGKGWIVSRIAPENLADGLAGSRQFQQEK